MLKVDGYSGRKRSERPHAFRLHDRQYKVKEVMDRWYGEGAVYFKVEADDDNIYLLKYEEGQDSWDLVFYQNPRKAKSAIESSGGSDLAQQFGVKTGGGNMRKVSYFLH